MTVRTCIVCNLKGTLAGYPSDGTEALFQYNFRPSGGLRTVVIAAHRSCITELKKGKVSYDSSICSKGTKG